MLRYVSLDTGADGAPKESATICAKEDFDDWCQRLRGDIVGEHHVVNTPFGSRKIVYCDYTASGRAVGKIESFIREQVLPFYGNTHTLTTATARQTTNFRHEARNIVRNYFNCDPQDDAVIFVENGTTGAVNKFVRILERSASWASLMWTPSSSSRDQGSHFRVDRWGSCECTLCNVRLKNENTFRSHCLTAMHTSKLAEQQSTTPARKQLLVLLDPWAHHSSSLPFREMRSGASSSDGHSDVTIAEFDDGPLFVEELIARARAYDGPKVAILAAGSNVTGAVRDVYVITQQLHAVGCSACWDFAAVAGHRKIDLNPKHLGETAKVDVAFFSPHKFLGGPGTCGILVAKKRLLQNKVPAEPGGGSVFFVTKESQTYIQTNDDREEAGTPNIVACIKTGLVFHLANQTPHDLIAERENVLMKSLLERWQTIDEIEILGGGLNDGLGIVSFMIRRHGLYLHYNFVVCLLNDLFGVQSRGGCACAGPFGQKLLGMDAELSQKFEHILETSGVDVIRPGFVRVGVHYTMSDKDAEVLRDAVAFVATHGWQFLPLYTFDVETGEWELRGDDIDSRRLWLTALDFTTGTMKKPIHELERDLNRVEPPKDEDLLQTAFDEIDKIEKRVKATKNPLPVMAPEVVPFLWFAMPQDFAADQRLFFEDATRPETSLFRVNGYTEPALPLKIEPAVEGRYVGEELINGYPKRVIKPSIPKPFRGLVGRAIQDFGMINDGDRLLVGLSGGKDSLSLLHVLLALQKSAPIKFEVAAATVNPQTPEYDPSPLIAYMEALGVKYHFLSKPLIEMAKQHINPKKPSICAFCSRMKRGMLYSCCREEGYNVLVLGQHLDDMAESFIMSAFQNGSLRTMKANYYVKDQDIRVCRPLTYVREKQMAAFSTDNGLPIIADNCPACFSAPKERHRIKLLLAREEFEHPNLFSSLLRTLTPLLHITTADRAKDEYTPILRTKKVGKNGVTADDNKHILARHQHAVQHRPEDAVEDEDYLAEEALMPCGNGHTACARDGCDAEDEDQLAEEILQPQGNASACPALAGAAQQLGCCNE